MYLGKSNIILSLSLQYIFVNITQSVMLTTLLKYSPLSLTLPSMDSEHEEHISRISDDCMKITMKAGADLSLEHLSPGGERISAFELAVHSFSLVKTSLSPKVH